MCSSRRLHMSNVFTVHLVPCCNHVKLLSYRLVLCHIAFCFACVFVALLIFVSRHLYKPFFSGVVSSSFVWYLWAPSLETWKKRDRWWGWLRELAVYVCVCVMNTFCICSVSLFHFVSFKCLSVFLSLWMYLYVHTVHEREYYMKS